MVSFCTALSKESNWMVLPSEFFARMRRHPRDFGLISGYRAYLAAKEKEAQDEAKAQSERMKQRGVRR